MLGSCTWKKKEREEPPWEKPEKMAMRGNSADKIREPQSLQHPRSLSRWKRRKKGCKAKLQYEWKLRKGHAKLAEARSRQRIPKNRISKARVQPFYSTFGGRTYIKPKASFYPRSLLTRTRVYIQSAPHFAKLGCIFLFERNFEFLSAGEGSFSIPFQAKVSSSYRTQELVNPSIKRVIIQARTGTKETPKLLNAFVAALSHYRLALLRR